MDVSQAKATPVKVGDTAPDFTLPMHPEGELTLSEHRGHTMILYWYPMDDTPGCTKQACSYRDLYADFNALDAMIFGISSDSLDSHQNFAEKFSLPFPLLTDEGGSVRSLYGNPDGSEPPVARMTYIVDAKGIVRHIIGGEGVSVEDHIDQSLAWARRLHEEMAGSAISGG